MKMGMGCLGLVLLGVACAAPTSPKGEENTNVVANGASVTTESFSAATCAAPTTVKSFWAGTNGPGYWLFTNSLACPAGSYVLGAPLCTHSAIMFATADTVTCTTTSCSVETTSPGIPVTHTPCSDEFPGVTGCGDFCTLECQPICDDS
jgi:hypothetical protein